MKSFLPLLGAIPFIIIFIGLTFTKIKSHITTLIALVVGSILAYFFWNFSSQSLATSITEGILVGLFPIILVIFAAVFTYFVGIETGAIETIKKFLIEGIK